MHRRSRTRFCRRKSCSLLSRLQLWLRNRWIGTRDTDTAPGRSASQTENTNVVSNRQPGNRRDLADAEVATALKTADDRYNNDWKLRPVAARAQIVKRAAILVRTSGEPMIIPLPRTPSLRPM